MNKRPNKQHAIHKTLSANMKQLRLKKGYTQEYVAEHLGIDRTTYSYYELCRTCPSILTLSELASLYAVSLDSLVFGTA